MRVGFGHVISCSCELSLGMLKATSRLYHSLIEKTVDTEAQARI